MSELRPLGNFFAYSRVELGLSHLAAWRVEALVTYAFIQTPQRHILCRFSTGYIVVRDPCTCTGMGLGVSMVYCSWLLRAARSLAAAAAPAATARSRRACSAAPRGAAWPAAGRTCPSATLARAGNNTQLINNQIKENSLFNLGLG